MSSLDFDKDILWYSREKDAAWLAEQLRASRLTVLQGQAGSGKTVLLRWGVLPRLRRRVTDPATTVTAVPVDLPPVDRSELEDIAGRRRVVVPFPDRRRNAAQPSRDVEIVVYLDSWEGHPLDALHSALREAIGLPSSARGETSDLLVEALDDWHRERGLRFLFVLDDFDLCLKASTREAGAREFIDQWVQAVSHPLSPAHFLISMKESAEPLWRLLTDHLRTLGHLWDHRLQLQGVSLAPPLAARPASAALPSSASAADEDDEVGAGAGATPPSAQAQPAREAPEPVAARASPSFGAAPGSQQTTVRVRSHSASVPDAARPTWVAASSDDVNFSGLQDSAHSARVDTSVIAPPAPPYASARDPITPHRGAEHGRGRRNRWAMPLVIVVVLLLAGAGFVVWDRLEQGKGLGLPLPMSLLPNRPAESPPTTAGGSLPTPGFELVTDAGDSSDDAIVAQLAQLVTPPGQASPSIRFPFGYAAEMASLGEQPRLAIFTNDMLQATRRTPGSTPLQIVTPLFNDEIYFLVRADSPLRYIHQIRSAKINVGPARGARALTANSVYDRLFGRPIPARQLGATNREEAVEQLLGDKSVDVVVLVGAQPDPWLQGMSPARKRQIRLLELDPKHWSTRKLVASYPATRVDAGAGTGLEPPAGLQTLSMRTFLVAAAPPAGRKDAALDQSIAEAASALCRNLPALKTSGHPKWREVQPGLDVEAAWPGAPAADQAFRNCGTRP